MKNTKKMPARAIIFARVSALAIEEVGLFDDKMRHSCKYCNENNLEVIEVVTIIEDSTRQEREKFRQLINLIKKQKGRIALIVDSIDRLQRGFQELSLIDALIKDDKLEIHCLKDDYIIDNNSRKILSKVNILMFGNCSKNLSDNVKRALQNKLLKGEWIGKAPFGYKNITLENGKKDIIIDEAKSVIVREIFELYSMGKFSITSLSKKFNLSKAKVLTILKNHFYYGFMKVNGQMYPHEYEKLISKELFDQCQKHPRKTV